MIRKEIIESLTNYNHWANSEMVNWLKSLDESLMEKFVESSFETISKTIQHMTQAQNFWLTHITRGNPVDYDWQFREQNINSTFDDLIISSKDMLQLALKEDESFFAEEIELDQRWLKNILPRYKHFIHVINHSTYHRGQIVTITRGLGINKDIPITDYNIYNSIV